ncbi:MAG TPA: diguanylate cyclase [Nitrospirales bacterium]|nr:diguanylate cyclase [Nitrospirales bacterium]HIO21821.1 diguanylate cyclase [Nitrospirales bacterium]
MVIEGETVEQNYSIMVLGEDGEMLDEVVAAIESDAFSVHKSVTAGLEQINTDGSHDGFVVCLPAGFQPVQESRQGTVIPPHANVMFVTRGDFDTVRFWAYQQGASDVVSWPTASTELRHRVASTVQADVDRFHRDLTEEKMLSFLRSLLDSGIQTLSPSLDSTLPNGFYYPAAVCSFGHSPYHAIALEQLTSNGIFTRRISNRLRACNTCGGTHLNYREVCTQCSSVDIVKTDTLHHFSCGHVGAVDEFRKGAGLECPKCAVVVRHIGVDYEKLSTHYRCGDCSHLSAEPGVQTQCMRCTALSTPHNTAERPIYQYTITDTAAVAAEEGRLSGLNLETVLRGGNPGLYTTQYFEHELRREMTRSIRYKSPYCVLLIRLNNLDAVRNQHAEKARDYINQVFEALSQGLRVLDTTCVWEADTLGVLLSSTPLEGGQLVVEKMQGYLQELDHLRLIQEPSITVSLISDKDENETAESTLAAAMAELNS